MNERPKWLPEYVSDEMYFKYKDLYDLAHLADLEQEQLLTPHDPTQVINT